MRQVLRAKSSYADADVAEVWSNIEQYVSVDEADEAVSLAAAEAIQVLGLNRNRGVYGWSGGKDSLALQVVMERVHCKRAVLGTIPKLEFQAYLDWVDEHKPEGLDVIENNDLDLLWLSRPENARYLFPRNSRDGYFWTLAGTRRAQHIYQERHSPDLQIYGRRTMDGNNIGGDPQFGIRSSQRLTVYCPLRSWSHEMVLAVVHYFGKELPPVYGWPHGWTAGTGSWPGRRVGTYDESWAETYAIEPQRVREAARFIPAASDWLYRNTRDWWETEPTR